MMVQSGGSRVGFRAAMRARDVSRPRPEDERAAAEGEEDLARHDRGRRARSPQTRAEGGGEADEHGSNQDRPNQDTADGSADDGADDSPDDSANPGRYQSPGSGGSSPVSS